MGWRPETDEALTVVRSGLYGKSSGSRKLILFQRNVGHKQKTSAVIALTDAAPGGDAPVLRPSRILRRSANVAVSRLAGSSRLKLLGRCYLGPANGCLMQLMLASNRRQGRPTKIRRTRSDDGTNETSGKERSWGRGTCVFPLTNPYHGCLSFPQLCCALAAAFSQCHRRVACIRSR